MLFPQRKGPWGSHSCRKTAYLLAVWGGGQDSDMMQSARHKTLANAIKYKEDATYLMELSIINGHDFINVPKWRPIYCKDIQLGRSINITGSRYYTNVPAMAKKFVETICDVAPAERDQVKRVVQSCISFRKPKTTKESLTLFLKKHLDDGQCVNAKKHF
jgi:hypothetical protein